MKQRASAGVGFIFVALALAGACAGKRLNNVGTLADGGTSATGGTGSGAAGSGGVARGEAGDGGGGGEAPVVPSAACFDGVRNGDETDVDCGGPSCTGCAPGAHCNGSDDCQSGECGGPLGNDRCEALHCGNHVQDLDESDVDCGGLDCDGCEEGQLCQQAADCYTQYCLDGVCGQRCRDSDDCGSRGACVDGSCVYCADSDECGPSQCTGDVAEARGLVCACRSGWFVCVQPSCQNGLEDDDESDVDCGGSSCAACAVGHVCDIAQDCSSGFCSGNYEDSVSHCFPESCHDGLRNGEETDVDCGGSSCPKCDRGGRCQIEDDCEARLSCTDSVCSQACGSSNSSICGNLGECVDRRCVECETAGDCPINCGVNDDVACHNQICTCVAR